MEVLITVYLFLVGAACGSFALVLVDRIKSERDWVKGRSACEVCGHTLQPIDLVPLLSWLLQRGRCRYCKAKLSIAYPLTELLTATLFILSYVLLPYELNSVASAAQFLLWLVLLVIMTALFVYDLRWKLLPVNLMNAAIVLGSVHVVFRAIAYDGSLVRYGLSICASVLVGAGVFWALHFVSRGKWIGDGDIRLGVIIGLFLADPVLSWAAIFMASLYGIVYALFTVPFKKDSLKLQIPFGPFLILGLVTSYLVGSRMVEWYLDTLLFV